MYTVTELSKLYSRCRLCGTISFGSYFDGGVQIIQRRVHLQNFTNIHPTQPERLAKGCIEASELGQKTQWNYKEWMLSLQPSARAHGVPRPLIRPITRKTRRPWEDKDFGSDSAHGTLHFCEWRWNTKSATTFSIRPRTTLWTIEGKKDWETCCCPLSSKPDTLGLTSISKKLRNKFWKQRTETLYMTVLITTMKMQLWKTHEDPGDMGLSFKVPL